MFVISENCHRLVRNMLVMAAAGSFLTACNETLVLDEATRNEAKIALGKAIFHDTNLSSPAGQSCASCHDAAAGFADPDTEQPTSEGVIAGRFGPRNTPSIAYASFAPDFHFDEAEGIFFGGQFLDGRAADLTEQAKGPFLNPLEMNNADIAELMQKIRNAPYANLLVRAYDMATFQDDEKAFQAIAESIAAFEKSDEFAPDRFTSKFDAFMAGEAELSAKEALGMSLFIAEDKGNCAACHPLTDANGEPDLLTDFSFDNLGVPANPNNLFYVQSAADNPDGFDFVDNGLGEAVKDPELFGAFKVPTLRNIGKTAPYMHNGVFQTLEEVVHFYNTRDTDPSWPAPEQPENVNTDELGNLGLSAEEESAIVAFLKTLDDGYWQR